jgi:hypothetical protein
MKSVALLLAFACAAAIAQPQPNKVFVLWGTFEFSNLSLFHPSPTGKPVAELTGNIRNNTDRPWTNIRFKLTATGHSPGTPQKKIVKDVEFKIATLPKGGPTDFSSRPDPIDYFEVDSYRLSWIEDAASAANREASVKRDKERVEHYKTHRQITLQVGGSTYAAFVTYSTGDGGIQQKEVSVPWSEDISAELGTVISISAQNRQTYGTVRVKILSGSEVLKEAVSEGEYVVASTTARIE